MCMGISVCQSLLSNGIPKQWLVQDVKETWSGPSSHTCNDLEKFAENNRSNEVVTLVTCYLPLCLCYLDGQRRPYDEPRSTNQFNMSGLSVCSYDMFNPAGDTPCDIAIRELRPEALSQREGIGADSSVGSYWNSAENEPATWYFRE